MMLAGSPADLGCWALRRVPDVSSCDRRCCNPANTQDTTSCYVSQQNLHSNSITCQAAQPIPHALYSLSGLQQQPCSMNIVKGIPADIAACCVDPAVHL
jgi:hypothetical protein